MGEGWSAAGIRESFPLDGVRSLYGATKLAAELMIAEYAALYGVRAVVNRCGVLSGPWQMGKVE
jgi:CDP-paratose 2-epimerase